MSDLFVLYRKTILNHVFSNFGVSSSDLNLMPLRRLAVIQLGLAFEKSLSDSALESLRKTLVDPLFLDRIYLYSYGTIPDLRYQYVVALMQLTDACIERDPERFLECAIDLKSALNQFMSESESGAGVCTSVDLPQPAFPHLPIFKSPWSSSAFLFGREVPLSLMSLEINPIESLQFFNFGSTETFHSVRSLLTDALDHPESKEIFSRFVGCFFNELPMNSESPLGVDYFNSNISFLSSMLCALYRKFRDKQFVLECVFDTALDMLSKTDDLRVWSGYRLAFKHFFSSVAAQGSYLSAAFIERVSSLKIFPASEQPLWIRMLECFSSKEIFLTSFSELSVGLSGDSIDECFLYQILPALVSEEVRAVTLGERSLSSSSDFSSEFFSLINAQTDFEGVACCLFSFSMDMYNFLIYLKGVASRGLEASPVKFDQFLMLNFFKMNQFYEILNMTAILFLKEKAAYTLQPLVRLFSAAEVLSEIFCDQAKKYFAAQKELILSDKKQLLYFVDFLLLLSSNEVFSKTDIVFFLNDLTRSNTPEKMFLHALKDSVSFILGQEVDFPSETLTSERGNILSSSGRLEFIFRLFSTFNKMKMSEYYLLYLKVLKCDLFGVSADVDKLFHDAFGCWNGVFHHLSSHNQDIRKLLTAQKINLAALNYRKEWSASIDLSQKTKSKESLIEVMLSASKKLLEIARFIDFDSLSKKRVQNLEKLLKNLKAFLDLERFDDLAFLRQLAKIKKLFLAVGAGEAFLNDEFYYHRTLFLNAASQLDSNGAVRQSKKTYRFIIKQWDKTDPFTFFLADEVGCCLSTNGSYFEALVQRRIDDAMLFHVAIDQETGKVAALLWLYLAENSKGKISLVMNFSECNIKYGKNQDCRRFLLKSLLDFSDEYCQENGIDGFYLNPPAYGWNIEDLKFLKTSPSFSIVDKVGGALILGSRDLEEESLVPCKGKDLTSAHYYLNSLDNEMGFIQYVRGVLSEEFLSVKERVSISSVGAGFFAGAGSAGLAPPSLSFSAERLPEASHFKP